VPFDHADSRSAPPAWTSRCLAHGLTPERFVPQLRRLLAGGSREWAVYDSLVDDIVAGDPHRLFGPDRLRNGAYLTEALYQTLPERGAIDATIAGGPRLAPLAYARWFTWRQVRDEIRAGTVHCRQVGHHLVRSRHDLAQHLRAGWVPDPSRVDRELAELLNDL
jgi:hypothetical protein